MENIQNLSWKPDILHSLIITWAVDILGNRGALRPGLVVAQLRMKFSICWSYVLTEDTIFSVAMTRTTQGITSNVDVQMMRVTSWFMLHRPRQKYGTK